jgi:zinc transport system permease protein
VSVLATNVVLLCLVALTVICLIEIVGLILVMALLTLPAATANHRAKTMVSVIAVSLVLCGFLTTVPRIAVYGSRVSPESAIVLSAAGLYLGSLGIKTLERRWMARRSLPPNLALEAPAPSKPATRV